MESAPKIATQEQAPRIKGALVYEGRNSIPAIKFIVQSKAEEISLITRLESIGVTCYIFNNECAISSPSYIATIINSDEFEIEGLDDNSRRRLSIDGTLNAYHRIVYPLGKVPKRIPR